MATIVGDVTDLQQRHYPQNIPHLVEEIKGEILQHIKNSGGGVRLANGHNNFQHLWPNDVGSCCVCLHVAYSNEFHSSPSSF